MNVKNSKDLILMINQLNMKHILNVCLVVFLAYSLIAQKVTIDQSIIVGADEFPENNIPINGSLLFYDISKSAFRAGSISTSDDFWSPQNIGNYSFSVNRNNIASGLYSSALGNRNVASGTRSMVGGYFSNAFGVHSFAFGERLNTDARNSFAVGRYNVGGGSTTSWVDSDPIFEVGIGTNSANRENAMTIRKDGTVELKEYSLPNEDGQPNQMLMTDGNGQASWTSTSHFQSFKDFRATISNSTWTVPTGVTEIMIEFWGAGGGGAIGGGGGGGGYLKTIIPVTAGEIFTIDLGAGGDGVLNGLNIDADQGENSTITSSTGLVLTAIGAPGATQANPGNGGIVVSNQLLAIEQKIDGERGHRRLESFYSSSTTLTQRVYGRGGNSPCAPYETGGISDVAFVNNGNFVAINNRGSDGRRPGGGGGGGGTYGNDGGDAYAIIRW
jgi:hypothetical protein